MRHIFWFLLSVFVVSVSQAQQEKPPATDQQTSRLQQHSVLYPEGVNGERFLDAYLSYRISDDLKLDLESFYSKFGIHQRLRSSLLLKAYLAKKFYILAGPDIEYDINNLHPTDNTRYGMNVGLGYEPKENWMFEARFNKQLNNTTLSPMNSGIQGDYLSFGSRLKF